MTEQQEFCLRWNDFHSNFHLSLEALRGDESFTDVTLSCSGRLMKAHRVILSACSVHFKEILRGIPPQQHPVIVLPTVDYDVMQAIMEFIYQGQVNVKQSQLGAFLQVAETFSIQGLADDETKKNANKTPGRPRPPDSEPPAAKRRRPEGLVGRPSLAQAGSPAAAAPPPPSAVAAGSASDPAERAEPTADPEKTVNISVSIKAEGMADTMVGELLDHSQQGQMLDPDMEAAGSDVVAQAMATMGHESADTSANINDSLRSLDSLVTALTSASRPAAAVRPARSAVRDFFSGDGQDRVCRLCGVGVRLNRQLSTSGLWSHMRHRHGETVRALGVRPPPAFWPAAAAAGAAEGAAPAPGWPLSPLQGRPSVPPRPPSSDCKAWFTQNLPAGRPERSPFRTDAPEGFSPDSI